MPEPMTTRAPSIPVPDRGACRVRVRYCECDPMGVAHHASYVPWLEMARTEILRDAGVTYAELEAAGVFLVVTKLEMRYRRPIRYDDMLEIRTRVVGGSRIKIRHEYEVAVVERAGSAPEPSDPSVPPDGVCSIGSSELACVDRTGRPTPLPEWLVPAAHPEHDRK